MSAAPRTITRQTELLLGPDGPIAAAHPRYEYRQEQLQMAQAVQAAIERQEHLIVEAGTGTGKSLAYLVPFIEWAVRAEKRVVVSTYTKTLQRQLVEADLPFLKRHLGIDFRFELCLGSQNYVCLRRLRRPRQMEIAEDPSTQARLSADVNIRQLREWAEGSNSGLNIDLPWQVQPYLWNQVNREPDLCLSKSSPYFNDCFYFRDRARQRQAHILVANHHLFFANVAADGFVLPEYDAVVFDEAHNIEQVAATYLGVEASYYRLDQLLNGIFGSRGAPSIVAALPGLNKDLKEALLDALDESREGYAVLESALLERVGDTDQILRLREPGIAANTVAEPLRRVHSLLDTCRGYAESDESRAEIEAFQGRSAAFISDLSAILNQAQENAVYWAQVRRSGRRTSVSFSMCPIDVSQELHERVFAKTAPVVLTSATLASNHSFAFIRDRLGLREAGTLEVGSPFHYEEQALLYIAADLPDPTADYRHFNERAIERTTEILQYTGGRAFVLCTSFHMVDLAYERLRAALPELNLIRQSPMAQGGTLEEFKASPRSVLLGTMSFWQGVDVPGDALKCVIITKLPFAMPDNPLVQARCEQLEARGQNAFAHYSLPQAIILFRQGFGRLIRSREDTGMVAILDPRIRSRTYGHQFLASLPTCRCTEELDDVARFTADWDTSSDA